MKKSVYTLAAVLALGGGVMFSTAGCVGSTTSRSTGEFVDDASITTRVKAAFAQDPTVKMFDVNVDTFKGTVQLNGFVTTPEEKSRAEQIARNVPGVMNVQNNLAVKAQMAQPGMPPPPPQR